MIPRFFNVIRKKRLYARFTLKQNFTNKCSDHLSCSLEMGCLWNNCALKWGSSPSKWTKTRLFSFKKLFGMVYQSSRLVRHKMCSFHHLNSKWESWLIHLESKFQYRRIADCHSQQCQCANEIDVLPIIFGALLAMTGTICVQCKDFVEHKGENWLSSFPIRFTLSFASFSTYLLGRSLRSHWGRWNPGGPRRLARPQRAQRGKRGATEGTEAAFQMVEKLFKTDGEIAYTAPAPVQEAPVSVCETR